MTKIECKAHTLFTPEVSYAKLFGMAQELCRLYKPNDCICITSQNRASMGGALLAAFSGGPKLVVPYATTPSIVSQAQRATGSKYLLEQGLLEELKQVEHHPSSFEVDPSSGVCVYLFTGGSTGRPKLWGKSSANLIGETLWLISHFSISAKDKILSCVPSLHIYGLLFSVLTPLFAQAQVCAETPLLPAQIDRLLKELRPTILVGGPAHYRALRKTELSATSLRIAFSSGGMLDPSDAARFSKYCDSGITEVYGSTETGGIAIRNRHQGQLDWTPLDVVGWKKNNDRLAVRSPFLSPELATDEMGFFTTSDRVEKTIHNRFKLLGRMDGIVKVAGNRVDLHEVEQHMQSLDVVEDACVITRHSPQRMFELVAVVVGSATEDELRRQLALTLPNYSIPRKWVFVDQIPSTAAGKRDHTLIQKLVDDRSPGTGSYDM